MLAASPHTLTQMLVDADGSMRAYSYTNVLRPIVVLEAVDLLRRFGNFVKGRGTSFFANPAKYPELQQFCQVRRPRPCWWGNLQGCQAAHATVMSCWLGWPSGRMSLSYGIISPRSEVGNRRGSQYRALTYMYVHTVRPLNICERKVYEAHRKGRF